ncbi:DUF3108 domain-containing protein [Massilia sp. CT11-137]|uniref:DUF3108 domain-containing protein n=1 Tax=Massilia sp. CT11-137 TaxID=3393901 RepID=UPI0039AEFC0A
MTLAFLSRHRRLLVLCVCSAAAHLALLQLLAARGRGAFPATPVAAESRLSVRLAPPAPVPVLAAPTSPSPATPAAVAAPARPRPAQRSAATPVPPPADAQRPAPDAPGTVSAAPSDTGPPLLQMPGRYRVRLPAPVQLTYDLVRQPAGGVPAPAGPTRLTWRTDGDRYVLDMDGVLGRLHSEGASGDAGIAPRLAREDGDAGPLLTEFDADGHRVLFRATGAESPDNVGIQDRASVLMQLAGIGLAEPDQVRDTLDVVVAGARDLRIARFKVLGREDVATGIGTLAAWHLAELAAPGMARLDIWLAPERNWLPVRLRVEDAGGSATQTLSALDSAPALP